uniref:DUF7808 domain-containing protein n=1 Tax=Acrobeloides nanus TaxID=290746 RepID=A0A914CQM6_9BILA
MSWVVKLTILSIFCIFLYVIATPEVPERTSYYWSIRTLNCINHGLNISRCSLLQEGRQTELNPGCFDEIDEHNETRVYCRINCEESDETTVLAKTPSWNHECNTFFTYHLERRRRDWYLWRSGKCITTTIAFTVRCGFPRDPREFYKQYKYLYEYDDAAK